MKQIGIIIALGIDAYCVLGSRKDFRDRVLWIWKPFLIPIYFIKINTQL